MEQIILEKKQRNICFGELAEFFYKKDIKFDFILNDKQNIESMKIKIGELDYFITDFVIMSFSFLIKVENMGLFDLKNLYEFITNKKL